MSKVVTVVNSVDAPLTMSSREIAKLTGKQHRNVLADIRHMLGQLDIPTAEFSAAYTAGNGQSYAAFNLPRRETDILLTGYSTPMRAKVIDRWRELEAQVAEKQMFAIPTTFAAALRLAGELEEQRLALTHQVEVQEQKIEQDAPKVEFYDHVAMAVGTQSVQDVAKEFGMGVVKFYKLLRDEQILMGHPNQNVPYQKHVNAGHFEVVVSEWKVQETGEVKLKPRPFVTPKGLIYLERRLSKLGYFRKLEKAA